MKAATVVKGLLLALGIAGTALGEEFWAPPSEDTLINDCSFEAASNNCSLWSGSTSATIPFKTVSSLVKAYGQSSGGLYTTSNTYITTSIGGKGNAELVTRSIRPSEGPCPAVCVSFLYKMAQPSTSLTLYQLQPGNGKKQVWQITGDDETTGEWKLHTSQIASVDPVRLSLSADVDGDEGSFLALDDIKIYRSTCNVAAGDSTQLPPCMTRGLPPTPKKATTWPNNVVPYVLTDGFSDEQSGMIKTFFKEVQDRTCVKFQQKGPQHTDYVKFVKMNSGCFSDVGKTKKTQQVSLGEDCFDYYNVSHTILHVLGLRHEHVRSDRDTFINVNLKNLFNKSDTALFEKRPVGLDSELESVDYNKQSVMHFPREQCAKPGTHVLESIADPDEELGNKKGATDSDFQKVANLYCGGTLKPKPPTRTTTTTPKPGIEDEISCTTTSDVQGRTTGSISNYLRQDGNYRTGETCGWRITVPNGKIVSFKIVQLDIQQSSSCSRDSVSIYDGADQTASQIASLCGQQAPSEDRIISSTNKALILFKTVTSNGQGFKISWDAVDYPGPDGPGNSTLSPADCTFDDSTCQWTAENGSPKWKRQLLKSVSPTDHTTQSSGGNCMSVDASNLPENNKTTTMKSARITDPFYCFTFWYRLGNSDKNVGTLELQAQTASGTRSLWKSGGDQTAYSSWVRQMISVDMFNSTPYRLVFKATIRAKLTGGISIDDTQLSADVCTDTASSTSEPEDTTVTTSTRVRSSPRTTGPRRTPTTSPRNRNLSPRTTTPEDTTSTTEAPSTDSPVTPSTSTTAQPSSGGVTVNACDFESSLCSWTNGDGGDIQWSRKNGKSTPGSDFGVSTDHTKSTATGYYLVANGLPTKGVARLDWGVQSSAGYKCFKFYYLTYGRHIGRVSVKAIASNGGEEMLLFEAAGNKAPKWQEGKASLNGLTGGYTLRIEAEVTGQADGDIAIDDTSFSTGECVSAGSSKLLQSKYQTPSNAYFCDFEDGQFCASTLHFTKERQALSWQNFHPADVTRYNGPSNDHSTSSTNGNFAGVSAGNSGAFGAITSKQFSNNEVNCLSFWYYMGSGVSDAAELAVYLVVPGSADERLDGYKGLSSNRGKWINPQVKLRADIGDFSIRFKATSSGSSSLILLDDVSLSRNDKCQRLERGLPLPGGRRRRRQAADDEDDDNVQGAVGRSSTTANMPNVQQIRCRFADGKMCDNWHQSNDNWKVVSTSVSQDLPGHDDRFAHVTSGRLVVAQNNNLQRGIPLPSAQLTSNLTGVLRTPMMDGKQSCLHFYYKIAGWFRDLPMDTLNLYVRFGSEDNSPKRLIGALSGSMTPSESVDTWEEKKFTLFETASFQLVFEATTGDSWVSSIAIDDITALPGSCSRA